MISRAKLYTLQLVPKLKTNRLLKPLLVDMKANSSILSILMRLKMAGISKNTFIVVPRVRVENQIN